MELLAGPPSRASALSLIELPRNVRAIVANAAGVRSMSSTGHPTQRSTILEMWHCTVGSLQLMDRALAEYIVE
jgi:hypothetical protein